MFNTIFCANTMVGDCMKDSLKIFGLMVLGLLSALFIYPLLHELGHYFFALCSGARIVNFTIFPLPSVLCYFDRPDTISVVMTGLGGVVFPFIISQLFYVKRFAIWFVHFVIDGICMLSFVISTVALILFQLGKPIKDDDVTTIMQNAPQYAVVYYAIFAVLMFAGIVRMVKYNPIKRCLFYFDIEK